MAIPGFESIADAQGNLNFKMFTDAAVAVPLSMAQNHAAHTNRVNVLAEQLLGAVGKNLHEVDVVQAVSAKQMLTGHAGADQSAAIALGQMLMKGAQTTPPYTGAPPAVPPTPQG